MDEDPDRLNVLYSEIEHVARDIAVLQAKQVRLLAEYNELYERSIFREFVTDEIALALHSTLNAANKRLTLATALVTRLPGTLAAMEAGDLDLPRAEAIAEATRPLSDELAGEVEDHVLAGAVQQNPNQVRRAAAKAVLQLDPDGAEQRHLRRREDRYVEILPAAEGMADLYALLPAEDAMRIKVRLDAYAKAQPKTDPRTTDQRRADAMTDLLLTRTAGPINATVHLTAPATLLATATQAALKPPRPTGHPRSTRTSKHRRTATPTPTALTPNTPAPTVPAPTVPVPAVLVPAVPVPAVPVPATPVPAVPVPAVPVPAVPPVATSAAASTASVTSGPATPGPATPALAGSVPATPAPTGSTPAGSTPGTPAKPSHPADTFPAELAGYGVITGSQAIALAAQDATWRRLLTDPATGDLTDLARHQYTPPAALADHVRARDRQCVFPGCAVPASRCDLDHRVPYPRGETSADNLAALCRHHHRLKHQGGWTLRRRADGAHVWTSPQEREYLNPTIPLAPPELPAPPPEPPVVPVVVDDGPPPF